jgi:hypothetical protein
LAGYFEVLRFIPVLMGNAGRFSILRVVRARSYALDALIRSTFGSGKEIGLVRTALMQVVVAIASIGLLQHSAMAQNWTDNRPVNGGIQAPPDGPGPTPATIAAPAAPDESPLFDNGLWEGAVTGPCCSVCGGGSGCPADWYTLQGFRAFSRSAPRRLQIAFQSPVRGNFAAVPTLGANSFQVFNIPGSTAAAAGLASTKGLNLDAAPGYQMTIGHYWCRDRNNNDHFVEFNFWGLHSWSDSKKLTGFLVPIYDDSVIYSAGEADLINAGLLTPQTIDGIFVGSMRTLYPQVPEELPGATPAQETLSVAFNGGLQYDYSYQSTMNNFEVNGRINPRGEPDRLTLQPNGKWRRECQPGTYMSYLYGLRFMQIDETFRFSSRSQFFDRDLQIQTASGNYDIVTHNNLLGLQIGADMTFRKCRWAWGVESKLGPFANFSDQTSTIEAEIDGQPGGAVHQRLIASRCQAALIGEVGFQATYKFRPNLVGRAAYDFMWVTALALAPEQLQFSADPDERINVNGSIFSQGVSLGLEWLW